ncbi:MAG: molybdopterin oxidoreductase family protein, partial [Chloroflexota bacterium]
PSICPHCAMGCNINLSVRKNDEVIRFLSRDNPEIDNSWLCDRGRFNYEFINSPERILSPLIRRGEAFEQVSWSEALQYIADRAQPIIEESGPDAVVGVASPRLSNEDLFAFKRFMTQTIGSGQVDHFPRSTMVLITPAQRAAMRLLDEHLTSIAALQGAETIVFVGADPSRRAPVMELRIREAVNKQGARLVILQSEDSALTSKAHQVAHFKDGRLADAIRKLTAALSTEEAPDEEMRQFADATRGHGPLVLIYDDTFEGVADKADALEAVASLVQALGPSRPVSILPLLDDCNSMGARDLEMFPVESEPWTASVVDPLLSGSSLSRVAFILGANIAAGADVAVARRLRSLDLLVVQELMMTETAQLADVILPAASFAEKEGTLTNLEGRVQMLTSAVPSPGIARSDWEILVDLSQYFERPLDYTSPRQIWNDIRASVNKYSGLGYEDIGPRGVRPASLQLV